jgi:hypothetical protein
MQQLELNGRTVQLSEQIGTVISSQKRSETKVTSSGGNAYNAPRVSSTVTTKHEFWVRTESDGDVPVQLTGLDIPIAEGQRVGLVAAEAPGFFATQVVQIVNYSARSSHVLNLRGVANNLLYPPSASSRRNFVFIAWLMGFFVLVALAASFAILWVVVIGSIGYFVYKLFRWNATVRDLCERFTSLLESRLNFGGENLQGLRAKP